MKNKTAKKSYASASEIKVGTPLAITRHFQIS